MSKGNQGIRSKNLVHKPVRTGAERKHYHPGGVAQLGQRQGNHFTDGTKSDYRGLELFGPTKPISVELGNSVAARTQCGPGGSRNIYKTGTNQTHGEVNRGSPMPKANSLWPGWEK